jgi:tetratricopeptide (TPR) repeat protein
MKGDGEAAARRLQDAIKHMEGSQSLLFLGVGWSWLGYSHCLMGQGKTAVDLTEKGLKMHTDLGIPWWRSMCHLYCSLTHFELGDTGEARRHGELALQFSVENKERQMQGLSRAWLGRVVVKTDPTQIDVAEQHIQEGINLLEELGTVAFSGLGYLWLGEVYAGAGRTEEALAPLKKAETMFRQMGMDYWLGKAQTALARL